MHHSGGCLLVFDLPATLLLPSMPLLLSKIKVKLLTRLKAPPLLQEPVNFSLLHLQASLSQVCLVGFIHILTALLVTIFVRMNSHIYRLISNSKR